MIGDAQAFHRFGLGPRPGDLRSDMRARLLDELDRADAALIAGDALPTTPEAMTALIEEREAGPQPAGNAPPAPQRIYGEELAARVAQAGAVGIGFVERLVAFWTNHFSIEATAGQTQRLLVGAYEREALRPHVLGNFRDLLLAATRHAAMLSYLDNAQSVGPDSLIGRRRGVGLNENHARELLELHTVGVDAGYTQDDVIALARILTGWSYVAQPAEDGTLGSFLFREGAHEPGDHTVMGVTYPAGGVEQGEAVLEWLASRPATAQHLARKLVRHFIADEQPELTDRLAGVFLDSGGDLKAVAAALVGDDAAWSDPTRLKLPQEYLWSAIRAIGIAPEARQVRLALASLGQAMWEPPSPQGFPDDPANWLAPDALTTRLDIAEILAASSPGDHSPVALIDLVLGPDASIDTRIAVQRAESESQGLALLLMSPEFQRR